MGPSSPERKNQSEKKKVKLEAHWISWNNDVKVKSAYEPLAHQVGA